MKTIIIIKQGVTEILFEAENAFEQTYINDFDFEKYDIVHAKEDKQKNAPFYERDRDKKWAITFFPKQPQ